MNIDQAGIDFIKSLESFRSLPYLDTAGIPTIGWGHTHEVTMNWPEISKTAADDFLKRDLDWVEKTIRDHIEIELSQSEYNALCSFIFNIGGLAFAMSTLLKKLNRGDKVGASKEFQRWDFCTDKRTEKKMQCEALLERRKKEQTLFLADINSRRSQID